MTKSPTEKPPRKQKGWRVDAALSAQFIAFCKARGWNVNHQVEDALRDWLHKNGARTAPAQGQEKDYVK